MLESSICDEPATIAPPSALEPQPENRLVEAYSNSATEYRRDDEIEVRTDHHCWIWKTLADLSASFGRGISALDAGCGTGRHFHCLNNVDRLVGLDLSPAMLAAARTPIRNELITARETDLVCGDVHRARFPKASFDLIYSLGMFGYGCELTVDLLNRFYEWLSPDGILLLDVTDSSGVYLSTRLRIRMRRTVYPLLPAAVRSRLDQRQAGTVAFNPLSRRELARLLEQTAFGDWEIYRRPCHSPCWSVDKFECVVAKQQLSPALVQSLRLRASAPAGV
jgi:SAM-dependent methyltransferase